MENEDEHRLEAERIAHETTLSFFEAYVIVGVKRDQHDGEIARGTPFSPRRIERKRKELREEKRSLEEDTETLKATLSTLEEYL